MLKQLSEKDFITQFSFPAYVSICEHVMKSAIESEAYKKDEPFVCGFSMCVVKVDGVDKSLFVEFTMNKPNKSMGILGDFGLVSIVLSDEHMPDEALDRLNEWRAANPNYKVEEFIKTN
jgi:hypothetical protein